VSCRNRQPRWIKHSTGEQACAGLCAGEADKGGGEEEDGYMLFQGNTFSATWSPEQWRCLA
jgi:hypothetical protein